MSHSYDYNQHSMSGYYYGYHIKYKDDGQMLAPSEPGDLCGKFKDEFVECINSLICCADGDLGYYHSPDYNTSMVYFSQYDFACDYKTSCRNKNGNTFRLKTPGKIVAAIFSLSFIACIVVCFMGCFRSRK